MRVRPFTAPLSQCAYLPDRFWQLTYAAIDELTQEEFHILINRGWRKFGNLLFRPTCPECTACQPIRVPVAEFKANRNQRRLIKKNDALIEMRVGEPIVDDSRVDLYIEHHRFHSETRSWPEQYGDEAISSIFNFISGPFPIEEWSYYIDGRLVGIAYIDILPDGFSGVYFYHSPEHREYSLGNWICLTMIRRAQELALPYIYFGYYIKGSISMEYKAAFQPNEVLVADFDWRPFMSRGSAE
jgi:leucyl-tRNA---protein transferase